MHLAPDPAVLADGCLPVPAGKIAAVVTSLEMTAPPPERPAPVRPDLAVVAVPRPDPEWYRRLFREVGGGWLWFARLKLADDALAAAIRHPDVAVHALRRDGADVGFFELDFRLEGVAELAYFGLVPDAVGGGAGRFLMNQALRLAWERPIRRLWVHTCTLDHPAALPFYLRSGFRPIGRQIEVVDDPRLAGLLPRDAAPHIPVIGT